jgi:hypothetical protein
MLTQYEVEKLRSEMHAQSNATEVTLGKCVAGLVLLLALGLCGRQIGQRDATVSGPADEVRATAPVDSGRPLDPQRTTPADEGPDMTTTQRHDPPGDDEFARTGARR